MIKISLTSFYIQGAEWKRKEMISLGSVAEMWTEIKLSSTWFCFLLICIAANGPRTFSAWWPVCLHSKNLTRSCPETLWYKYREVLPSQGCFFYLTVSSGLPWEMLPSQFYNKDVWTFLIRKDGCFLCTRLHKIIWSPSVWENLHSQITGLYM